MLKKDFFSYYRRLRPEKFSDTFVVYELPLTKEIFAFQMERLSVEKKQNEFERFVIRCASRLITPNIKPQTDPDGHGDGKVDGETYQVASEISDRWYVANGCKSDEKWAIAISCVEKWKPKLESDVKKIVDTGRGYTKVLFFSNRKIKSSIIQDTQESLGRKYGIVVEIYDASWCESSALYNGCRDIALEELNFSDDYRRKSIKEGPLDKKRRERLEELEKALPLRNVDGLDTQYVDDLMETYVLSRGLERPRQETEGRFARAMRECESHGTTQQRYNIIYDHGWTSFFWFEDVDATYQDYLKMKEMVDDLYNVFRVEKLTNLLTNLENVVRIGLFDESTLGTEVEYIKSLQDRIGKDSPNSPSKLYLDIYVVEHRLINHLMSDEPIEKDLAELEPLLLSSVNYPDIGFNAQYTIMSELGRLAGDNEQFESLVDKMANLLAESRSEVEAARVHLERGVQHMDAHRMEQAVRQFGFCVQTFEKEDCEEELVKACGMMGMAMYEMDLPFCAEAYLIKSASTLVREFYSQGIIEHLLITVLDKLCEIELMTGRFVMFLNWRELMWVLSRNADFGNEPAFEEGDMMYDASWACRFAETPLDTYPSSVMPNILDRNGMPISSNFLKYRLGYKEEVDSRFMEDFGDNWEDLLVKQPVLKQVFCDMNVSTIGEASLHTKVNNCIFDISFQNTRDNYLTAATFLAAVESLLSTAGYKDLVIVNQKISILIEECDSDSEFISTERSDEYVLRLNRGSFDGSSLWECFSEFIARFFCTNTLTRLGIEDFIKDKHDRECLFGRVSALMNTGNHFKSILGNDFKHYLEDWGRDGDKIYALKGVAKELPRIEREKSKQDTMTFLSISSDIKFWEQAGWKGCGFIFDERHETPPMFALAFKNIEYGNKIFEGWKSASKEGNLNIVIYLVSGINRDNRYHYRVCVAPDMAKLVGQDSKRFVATLCRKHTMTPSNDLNFRRLREEYSKYGGCWMLPLELDARNRIVQPRDFSRVFKFTRIEFREAFEISTSDLAKISLESDDIPFIPEGRENDAPVIKVLEELRKLK